MNQSPTAEVVDTAPEDQHHVDIAHVQELADLVLRRAAEKQVDLRLVGAVANMLILECMIQSGSKAAAMAFGAVAMENINVAVQAVVGPDSPIPDPE